MIYAQNILEGEVLFFAHGAVAITPMGNGENLVLANADEIIMSIFCDWNFWCGGFCCFVRGGCSVVIVVCLLTAVRNIADLCFAEFLKCGGAQDWSS